MIKYILAALLATGIVAPSAKISQPDPPRIAITVSETFEQAQADHIELICAGLSETFKTMESNDPYDWDVYVCWNAAVSANWDDGKGQTLTQIFPVFGQFVWGKVVLYGVGPDDHETFTPSLITAYQVRK